MVAVVVGWVFDYPIPTLSVFRDFENPDPAFDVAVFRRVNPFDIVDVGQL